MSEELEQEIRRLRARVTELEGDVSRLQILLANTPDIGGVLVPNGRIDSLNQELAMSQGRLDMVIEAVGVGMWEWEVQSGELLWDEQTYEIYGLGGGTNIDFEGFMGQVHPSDREALMAVIRSATKTGEFEPVEHRIVRRDGEVRWVRCHGSVQYQDRELVGILGGVFDITDTRRREQQQRQAQKMEALGRLTAGIAHNFNNMLTAILPNIELALMDAPAAMVGRLEEAEAASLRASEMIRQLMIFSRPSAGGGMAVVDLRQVVREVVDISRRTFNRRIRLELDLPDAPVRAMADATQLEQALLNVCLNARDAVLDTPDPKIGVSVRVEDGVGTVEVTDNGVGIPKDSLSRVFEPFFTTKAVGKGTGLGLATSYAILQDHQGELSCESVVGEGATFMMSIPLTREVEVFNAVAEAQGLPRGTEKVLVVDDEPPVRRAIASMLRIHGYEVEEAKNGREALEVLSVADHFDLLILDLWMPAMTGEELLKKLPKNRGYKVVVVSGAPVDDEVTSSVDSVWAKPVRARRLLRDVRVILDE